MKTDQHIERAKRAYKSFKLLKEKDLLEDAVSRGYYAIVHIGFSILRKADKPLPKTHGGLVAKLWEYKSELKLPDEIISSVSRFEALREKSDYAPLPIINKEDIDEMDKIIKKFFRLVGEKI